MNKNHAHLTGRRNSSSLANSDCRVEHVVERRHRHRLGAMGAKKAAERVKGCIGGQCSVTIPDEVGPPNGDTHAEAIMGLGKSAACIL